MADRAEAPAKKFDAKVQEATAHEILGGVIKTIADGKPGSNFPMDALHAMNDKHAQEHANCTKAETLALHTKNAAAAAIVRGLRDVELDRSGTVIAGMPAMSAAQLAEGYLVGHIDEHLGSIRATVGS